MTAVSCSPDVVGKSLPRLSSRRVLESPSTELAPVFRSIPGWAEVDTAAVVTERISGALTNLVFRCTAPDASCFHTVIVRLFGPGNSLFSQKEERDIFLLAGQTGIGPHCLLEFEGGRVEEFIPGATLSAATMRAPAISNLVASSLAAFHARMTTQHARLDAARAGPLPSTPAIYRRIARWHAAAQRLAPALLTELGLDGVMQEVGALEQYHARHFPLWLGFCHNDLQYGNMLLCAGSDALPGAAPEAGEPSPHSPTATLCMGDALGVSGGHSAQGLSLADPGSDDGLPSPRAQDSGISAAQHIRLIDYEYSTGNDVAFDVANHWCEYAADYHAGGAHALDFAALPSAGERRRFAAAYVAATLALAREQEEAGEGEAGEGLATTICSAAAGDEDALTTLLVRKAEAFMPLSHLKWGLWGILQAQAPDVDFDYAEYSRQRIAEYHISKQQYL